MVAVLHNIRSLYNVGSIFRTADAAGIDKLYLTGITPSPFDRFGNVRQLVAKVALGAERYVRWEKRRAAGELLKRLKKDGYRIFAVEQSKKSTPYHKIPKSLIHDSKICLVFGHERRGLTKTIINKADKILEIPMFGRKESLNVAVAFGVVVFHLRCAAKSRDVSA